MKFAALVLLLAVGSQAASLQADAPDQLTQYRAKVKEGLVRVLTPLDTTSYKDSKDTAIETFDTKLGEVLTMGQGLFSTVSDATEGIRDTLKKDAQTLQASIATDAETLRENVLKHLRDYVGVLTPLKEHLEGKRPELEAIKIKVIQAAEQIGEKVPKNWEETRGSFAPIAEKVKQQAAVHMEMAEKQIGPYVTEYKDSFQAAMNNPNERLRPLLEEFKAKMAAFSETLNQALARN
ncbi:apolipoprotein A-Ib [Stegastes partitus]|uniref:Apolipoprotein A-IV n=1 Tax=Stegastes partitus TaxID=144197 RepID=A0A3B5B283_9TELE|nr:PREDICTED: apolipoprotein A-IV [Stegastes partitus]